MAKLAPEDQATLKAAQRAWLAFMAQEEKFWWPRSMYGEEGTIAPMEVRDIGRSMLRQRVCNLLNYKKVAG